MERARDLGDLCRHPRSIAPRVRVWLLELWRLRGGGFYGLGYVLAFVYFESTALADEFFGSQGAAEFAVGQLFERPLRFSVLSFVSALQAFIWPVYCLGLWNGLGMVLLPTGYLLFEKVLRARIEARFPELARRTAADAAQN